MAPSPTFTVQSSSGRAPRRASDDKLRAYCKLLRTRTPGVCYAATEEGAFARWVQACLGQGRAGQGLGQGGGGWTAPQPAAQIHAQLRAVQY